MGALFFCNASNKASVYSIKKPSVTSITQLQPGLHNTLLLQMKIHVLGYYYNYKKLIK